MALKIVVKGSSHRQLNPVQWTLRERKPQSRAPIIGGMKLFLLDSDYLKSWAASRMSPQSRQPLRLHRDCEESLAKQLTAEELVRERGKRVWKKKRKDNHYFDCLYMNMACVHSSWTPSLTRLAGDMDEEPAPQPTTVPGSSPKTGARPIFLSFPTRSRFDFSAQFRRLKPVRPPPKQYNADPPRQRGQAYGRRHHPVRHEGRMRLPWEE